MARGDVVADVVSTSHDSSTDIRPASGVEWVIKTWEGDNNGSMFLRSNDGSNVGNICTGAQAGAIGGLVTIPINNTNYLAVYNGAGGTRIFAYYGYITKD